jgi:Cyclic nucleotide-binding domain
MTWVEALSWLGTVLAISGTAMKTIIPLRCVGIAGNLVALVCSAAMVNVPGIAANLILLPVNSLRLVEMVRLVARVKQAAQSDLSMEWLKPYMSRRSVAAGDVLFAKGDRAECMYYTLTGRYRLKESGLALATGQVVGEMGFLAPRTAAPRRSNASKAARFSRSATTTCASSTSRTRSSASTSCVSRANDCSRTSPPSSAKWRASAPTRRAWTGPREGLTL